MTQHAFDGLAFEIERQMRGVETGRLQRTSPCLSEMDALCASMEVARYLRDNWTLTRKAADPVG